MLVNSGKAIFGCYFVQYKHTMNIYDNSLLKVHCNLHFSYTVLFNNIDIACMGMS